MSKNEFSGYVPLCEQYNGLAQSFYKQYQEVKAQKGGELYALQAAICAVVFEAFAIESYVNFFGAYTLGDNTFYSTYESGQRGNRFSTIDKIKGFSKKEGIQRYPTGGKHFVTLKGLLYKRDQLAHNKPRMHTLRKEDGFEDYNEMSKEISFVYQNLDEELKLYDEVKMNLSIACDVAEPISEMILDAAKAIGESILELLV